MGLSSICSSIAVILLIIAHVILGLQVTSFVRTIFAKHRRMPDQVSMHPYACSMRMYCMVCAPLQFCLSEDQLETLESSVSTLKLYCCMYVVY